MNLATRYLLKILALILVSGSKFVFKTDIFVNVTSFKKVD